MMRFRVILFVEFRKLLETWKKANPHVVKSVEKKLSKPDAEPDED